MYNEERFIAKLNAGETFTQEELEDMVLHYNIDDVAVDDLEDTLQFVPVAFDGQKYLILCNYRSGDTFLHQPIKAAKDWKDHWTPVEDVETVFGRWSNELAAREAEEVIPTFDEPENLIEVTPELLEQIHAWQEEAEELFGSLNELTCEEQEAVSRYMSEHCYVSQSSLEVE